MRKELYKKINDMDSFQDILDVGEDLMGYLGATKVLKSKDMEFRKNDKVKIGNLRGKVLGFYLKGKSWLIRTSVGDFNASLVEKDED